jgi:hypothetical protein
MIFVWRSRANRARLSNILEGPEEVSATPFITAAL